MGVPPNHILRLQGAVACLSVDVCWDPPLHLETIYKVAGAIYKLLGAIYKVLDAIYKLLDAIYKLLDAIYKLLDAIYKLLDAIYKLLDAIYRLSKHYYQRNMMLFIKCGVYGDIARAFSHGYVALVSHGGNSNLGYCVITHQFFRYSWMVFFKKWPKHEEHDATQSFFSLGSLSTRFFYRSLVQEVWKHFTFDIRTCVFEEQNWRNHRTFFEFICWSVYSFYEDSMIELLTRFSTDSSCHATSSNI